jgi:hypothetical protein
LFFVYTYDAVGSGGEGDSSELIHIGRLGGDGCCNVRETFPMWRPNQP